MAYEFLRSVSRERDEGNVLETDKGGLHRVQSVTSESVSCAVKKRKTSLLGYQFSCQDLIRVLLSVIPEPLRCFMFISNVIYIASIDFELLVKK
jgi:hypothetical protein